MFEPIKYKKMESDLVNHFCAMITPDGWRETHCKPTPFRHIPEEILDETKIVRELMKICPTYEELKKFFKKHGKRIACEGVDPTLAFTVDHGFIAYTVQATGPYLEILAYRTK